MFDPKVYDSALFKIVERVGSIAALAKILGVSRQVVYTWVRARGVPLRQAIKLEQLYGTPRQELVYPKMRAFFSAGNISNDALSTYLPRI